MWKLALAAIVGVIMLGSASFTEPGLAASCPSGKITCFEWCRKYNASSHACLSGGSNSCATKVGGNDACVGDVGRKMITCEGWCKKYRGNSESCLFTHPNSCMKKHGSLKAMVGDSPP
jgi:hypothetical protein